MHRQYSTPPWQAVNRLLSLSGPGIRTHRAWAAEHRARARLMATLSTWQEFGHRQRAIEARLRDERRPAVRRRLLEELDALEPLAEAAEALFGRLAAEHAAARARLAAEAEP